MSDISVADTNQIKETLSLAIENDIILSRVAKLEDLTNGWLDGAGKAIDKELLEFFVCGVIPIFAYMEEVPYIAPTEEGGISIEYEMDNTQAIMIEILPDFSAYYHYMDLTDDTLKNDVVHFWPDMRNNLDVFCEELKKHLLK